MCEIAEVSTSGYYKHISKQKRPNDDAKWIKKIRSIQNESYASYGSRRMTIALRNETGRQINRKKVARLQRENSLSAVSRRRKQTNHLTFAPGETKNNLLQQNFEASKPNQKWVTDITEIKTSDGKLYISALMDLFDRQIIAFQMSANSASTPLVTRTIEQAFQKHPTTDVLIHSDQGGQYRSFQYQTLLRKHGAVQSMSRPGCCHDNAVIENFFGHLKAECTKRLPLLNSTKLMKYIEEYIHFFNQKRIQTQFKMAPIEYRSHQGYAA